MSFTVSLRTPTDFANQQTKSPVFDQLNVTERERDTDTERKRVTQVIPLIVTMRGNGMAISYLPRGCTSILVAVINYVQPTFLFSQGLH